jgi:hypothetical protein
MKSSVRLSAILGLFALVTIPIAVILPVPAQQGQPGGRPGGGQNGQNGNGNGNGGLSNLVPPGIDLIIANPADNSLIVRDPPVDDPNAPPKLVVRAQWLEMMRSSTALKRFKALDSPEVTLSSGVMGEIKVKNPVKTVSYPIRIKLDKANVITASLYAPNEPGRVLYQLDRKEDVHPGDSVVINGIIAPQQDGGQKESYLQLTFNLPPKEEPDKNLLLDEENGKNIRPAGKPTAGK